MRLAIIFTLVSITNLTNFSVAQAQMSIRELQNNSGISLTGEVTQVVGNEFILDDGTGQIIVDAGPRWYHQINVSPGERLTVVGEYDGDDFDAFTITRSNGEVITVRSPGGPPPWSGGRQGRAK